MEEDFFTATRLGRPVLARTKGPADRNAGVLGTSGQCLERPHLLAGLRFGVQGELGSDGQRLQQVHDRGVHSPSLRIDVEKEVWARYPTPPG